MSELDTLNCSMENGCYRIELNRPEFHNAFNAKMISELTNVFDEIATMSEVRLVVLSGAGKSFSAGADLAWMKEAASYSEEQNRKDAVELAEMLRKLAELPVLTLARVHGAAMGGGAGLVSACDVVIARADTKFSFSEVRLGLTPATISPFVIRAIGARWAKALFMTGERFDGTYAERIGLVHYAVQTDEDIQEMEAHIMKLVLSSAPGAISDSKRLVLDLADAPYGDELSQETARRIAARRASPEGREGISAFLEKRKPSWSSKSS